VKKILIASYDMEVGGVERSLISMLENFNYEKYKIDLMLYKHQGDFMSLLTDNINLLDEVPEYTSFRKSISQLFKEKYLAIGISRLLSKTAADLNGKIKGINETGYYQMQLMWKYALPFLPRLEQKYDVAISYLWPHYFIAEKVTARTKIAWIHTDYSTVDTDVEMDLKMWNKFDHIVAVSDACKQAFLKKYPKLGNKVLVIENITSPDFIKTMASEDDDNPLLKDTRFKLVTVARLSHAKGIDNAVKALNLLKNKGYENIVWYVVGYGGDEQLVKDLIAKYQLEKQFILLGKKTNPYPIMKAADLYVQPSRYEGKAVTVGEAQILSRPVLITNYTTANSQVLEGVDGVICELSVEGIAKGIEDLFNDKKLLQRLKKNCDLKNYSNKHELEKLYKIIDSQNNELLLTHGNRKGVI
jgi:glycosyltransferase involved in cell wall biosynthesis